MLHILRMSSHVTGAALPVITGLNTHPPTPYACLCQAMTELSLS